MKKSKTQQAKLRNLANESVILSELERIITVVFHAELADISKCSENLDLIAHVKLNHQFTEVRLYDCFAKCLRENETIVYKELIEKRLVLDFEAIRNLLRSDVTSFVKLYLLSSTPSATDLDAAQKNNTAQVEERVLVNSLDTKKNLVSNKKATALSGGIPKVNAEGGSQKVSAAVNFSTKADEIFSVPIYLEDVMRSRSQTYPAEVSRLGFLKHSWIEVRVRDDCLIPDALFHKCFPVSVRVTTVQQLDKLLAHEKKQKHFRVAVQFAGQILLSPYHSVMNQSECTDILRGAFLLGDQTPLEVYQMAMLSPVKVSLNLVDEVPTSSAAFSGSDQDAKVEHLADTGVFSVQAFATDRQTYFDTDVQLLPTRTSFAFHAENSLTAACAVRVKVNFFNSLPILHHVDEHGELATMQFLSRSMIMIPYTSPCITTFLDTMIRELLSSKRARRQNNVTLYQPPTLSPEPLAGPEEVNTESMRTSKTALRANHRGRNASEGVDRQSASPPQVTSSLSKSTPFEQPFQVVTPPGISGFEVADGKVHFICLEGPIGELHRIIHALYAASGGSSDVKFWFNSELFVPMRYYNYYPPLVTPPGKQTEEYLDTENSSHSASPSNSPSNLKETVFAIADLDVDEAGGGCGGRIHRIRLNRSLLSLAADPRYLLRHTLSDECLGCIHMLHQLRQCHTLREAFLRGLFPTAEGLIALERTFGSTLSLVDIFGQDEYKSSTHCSPSLVHEGLQSERVGTFCSTSEANIGKLGERDVGRLTFFQGIRIDKGRAIPPRLSERFRKVFWMQTDTGEEVLCAFQKESPSGTIRYHIDGQVVRFDNTYLLYVLAQRSLAKSMTNSKNLAFETILRERNRQERK